MSQFQTEGIADMGLIFHFSTGNGYLVSVTSDTNSLLRYGRPDPLMERQFDISAKVRMASVRYLHTMRFLKEILAFLSHFPQLIDAFQRMKAMAKGNLVSSLLVLSKEPRESAITHPQSISLLNSTIYEWDKTEDG